jgi:hypothetical protein
MPRITDVHMAEFYGRSCEIEIARALSNDRRVAHEFAAMRARRHAMSAHRFAMLARPDLRDEPEKG